MENTWLWYQAAPYSNTINTIATNQIIWNQIENININWEKNIYTYEIQLWALVDFGQSWWDYIGNVHFNIELDY